LEEKYLFFKTMSQTCAISSCKRPSCALCHCCQQNICLPHLNEHQDLLVCELNPLVDQINTLGDRFKAVNVDDVIGDARQKLEEWRVECHQKIDYFFKQKCRELHQQVAEKIDKQREKISRVQSKAAELIREQHATRRDLDLLTSTIVALEQEVNKFELTSFNVRCQSLASDDNWIVIEELGRHRFNLSAFSAIDRTIKRIDGSWPIATGSDHILLMHEKTGLCLVDRTLRIRKQAEWNGNVISDMCYSSVLDRFIVISPAEIFFMDQNTMSMRIFPSIQRQKWLRGTCSNTSLFLSTYELSSSIMEYSLLSSIEFVKHWKSPDTCQKNEMISYMKCNNESLALIITEPLNKTVRLDVKNIKTLARFWSLPLNDEKMSNFIFSCCSFNEDEWLLADSGTSRLLHISNQGKLIATYKYPSKPHFVSMFGSNILAISTDNELNLHNNI
jgi:hypothetical protein